MFLYNYNTMEEVVRVTEVVQRRCDEGSEKGEVTSSCSLGSALFGVVRNIG